MKKIATWNINSVCVREHRLIAFLERFSPDIVALQELKCIDEKFPRQSFEERGYHCSIFGQKAYNGVAILSREKPLKVVQNFADGADDPSARALTAYFADLAVTCVYVPNGQQVGSEKFFYKLDWLRRLKTFVKTNFKPEDPFIVLGDFNIAPDDRDVYDPLWLQGKLHCSVEEREALADFASVGLADLLRVKRQEPGIFSWWDYRELSFPQNKGLRIDLIYGTPAVVERCQDVKIDRDERKGEKPSDHAPVIAYMQ